jgi:3-dehydroquinate synthase
MHTVTVDFGSSASTIRSRGYTIHVGPGLIDRAGELMAAVGLRRQAVIITDTTVGALHAARLQRSLAAAGFQATILESPAGEEQKSLDAAALLYSDLTALYAERTTPIVALGGGVIGDLAGFVAATYMRGVPLVQVPTTILAQGDSSIGGKVAVNHGNLKNKIGAFYQPALTISDVTTLSTLSPRATSDGLAEIIKHGMILDSALFEYLENHMSEIRSLDATALERIIENSARLKARVVERDELDLGPRNILNYGHTVGHAVESVSGLKVWHGEAVAIGMVAEASIARRLGILDQDAVSRLTALLHSAGLPTSLPALDPADLFAAMQHDKKVTQGKLQFALPASVGTVIVIDNVDTAVVKQALVVSDANP